MKLGFFTKKIDDNILSMIKDIKDHTQDKYDDTVVFTPTYTSTYSHLGSLHPFYMTFFDGDVIFLSEDDYIQYKDEIIGDSSLHIHGAIQNA